MDIFEKIESGSKEIENKKQEIKNIALEITSFLDDIYIQDVVIKEDKLKIITTTFYNQDSLNTYCLTTTLTNRISWDGGVESFINSYSSIIESDLAIDSIKKTNREKNYILGKNKYPILAANYSSVYKENL